MKRPIVTEKTKFMEYRLFAENLAKQAGEMIKKIFG